MCVCVIRVSSCSLRVLSLQKQDPDANDVLEMPELCR